MGKPKQSKHEKFILKHRQTLAELASEGFQNQGKGVLVVRKERGVKDFEVIYIPQEAFLESMGTTSNEAKRFKTVLDEYDPQKEFAMILHLKRKPLFFIWQR